MRNHAIRHVQYRRAIINGQLNEVHVAVEELPRSPEGRHSRSTTQPTGVAQGIIVFQRLEVQMRFNAYEATQCSDRGLRGVWQVDKPTIISEKESPTGQSPTQRLRLFFPRPRLMSALSITGADPRISRLFLRRLGSPVHAWQGLGTHDSLISFEMSCCHYGT